MTGKTNQDQQKKLRAVPSAASHLRGETNVNVKL